VALLGKNGAGKSTLRDAGRRWWRRRAAREIIRSRLRARAKLGLRRVAASTWPATRGGVAVPDLGRSENLDFQRKSHGSTGRRRTPARAGDAMWPSRTRSTMAARRRVSSLSKRD